MRTLIAILLAIMLAPTAAFASGGGQVKQSNPLYDSSGEVIGIEVPVEACENYEVVKAQSGKVLYVICADEK